MQVIPVTHETDRNFLMSESASFGEATRDAVRSHEFREALKPLHTSGLISFLLRLCEHFPETLTELRSDPLMMYHWIQGRPVADALDAILGVWLPNEVPAQITQALTRLATHGDNVVRDVLHDLCIFGFWATWYGGPLDDKRKLFANNATLKILQKYVKQSQHEGIWTLGWCGAVAYKAICEKVCEPGIAEYRAKRRAERMDSRAASVPVIEEARVIRAEHTISDSRKGRTAASFGDLRALVGGAR